MKLSMGMKNKVFVNAGWIIGCKLGKAVLTLLVTMFTARYLGVANYGLISYAASVVSFAVPLMRLGLDAILVREIVARPDSEGETVGTATILNFASSLLCVLGVTSFAAIANHGERDTIIVCFLYSLLLIFQSIEIIYYWFQAKLLAKYSAMAMLLSYVTITVLQCILIWQKVNVYWFALSHSVDYLLIAIFLFVIYKRKDGQKFSFSFSRAKEMLNIGKHYILSSLMVSVYSNIGRIMLKFMYGNAETGIYSAAVTCAGMTSFVFAAIIDSMRPAIFESQKKSTELFNKKISQLYCIMFYFSIIQCVAIAAFAPLVVKIMYGSAYAATVPVLRILVWYTTYTYFGVVRDIWILSQNKQKYLWRINLFGVMANIVLNMVLIPAWGAIGAALATLLTRLLADVLACYIIKPLRFNAKLMVNGLKPSLLREMLTR